MSFLLTTCMPTPESATNFLSSNSKIDAAGSTHSSECEWNVTFVLFFESFSCNFFSWQNSMPCQAHRCYLSISSWDLSSNFTPYGCADENLWLRSSCESYSSNWSQNFCALPWIDEDCGGSASCDTKPNCRTHFTLASAFCHHPSSFSIRLFTNLTVRKRALCVEFAPDSGL